MYQILNMSSTFLTVRIIWERTVMLSTLVDSLSLTNTLHTTFFASYKYIRAAVPFTGFLARSFQSTLFIDFVCMLSCLSCILQHISSFVKFSHCCYSSITNSMLLPIDRWSHIIRFNLIGKSHRCLFIDLMWISLSAFLRAIERKLWLKDPLKGNKCSENRQSKWKPERIKWRIVPK